MWNFIGNGDDIFEMRLQSRNGRKSVSEKHTLGLNRIWRFAHCSRQLGPDIVDGAKDIVDEMGCEQARMSPTSIAMISSLDSDYMMGNEDKVTEEFEPCSRHPHDTSMSIISALPSDDVPQNEAIPTETIQDPELWSSL